MTGTDKSLKLADADAPDIILIEPQMGENIGACARAMLNCGMAKLVIVNPRDGWPNAAADAMSSGALERMPPVRVCQSAAEAIAPYHYIYATTARPRDMVKPVLTARGAAADIHKRHTAHSKTAILFGPERSGLSNDDVALAHAVITIPLNPGFSSLNLAQCVLLVAYEWYQALEAQQAIPAAQLPTGDSAPATHGEYLGLMRRLEDELAQNGFFRSPDMKPSILRNLKNMMARAEMTDQEIRTFHGIISALTGKKTP